MVDGEVSACVCARVAGAGVLGRVSERAGLVCDGSSVRFVCRSGGSSRRRRWRWRGEGRAVRGAVEGLRGAGLQHPAARGEGLLLPAGAHRAGEATQPPNPEFVSCLGADAVVPSRFFSLLRARARACVGFPRRIPRGGPA